MAKLLTETRVHLTMSADQVEALDEWRRDQADLPPRAEAIRRLLNAALAAQQSPAADTIRNLINRKTSP